MCCVELQDHGSLHFETTIIANENLVFAHDLKQTKATK